MKKISWLLIALFALSAAVLPAAVTVKKSAKGVIMENDFVKFEVIKQGGRIISLVDKKSQVDLLAGDKGVFAGLGKVREMMGQSIGLMAGSRTITVKSSTPEAATVEVVYNCRNGLIHGLEIVKTYTLRNDSAAIEFSELYRSKIKDNRFVINWHNRFPLGDLKKPVTFFSGRSDLTLRRAFNNRNNYLLKPDADFLGWIDQKKAAGVVMFLNERNALDHFYVWADSSNYSLEATFREVALRPIVGADEWIVSGSLVPFNAKGKVLDAKKDALVSIVPGKGKSTVSVVMLRNLGKGKIYVNKQVRNVESIKAGDVYKFEVSDQAAAVKIVTANKEIELNVPPAAERKKSLMPSRTAPVKKIAGVNGFFYYYPTLWVSREVTTEIMFGLRGNFRRVKNFRLALCLPAGVDISYCLQKVTNTGKVKINGKEYNCFEIPSKRRVSYHGAISVDLTVAPDFRDAEGYVFAKWDGGSQIPERFAIRETPAFPQIGKGLKELRIGLGINSALDKKWQVPQFNKFGVNVLEYWEYLPKIMFVDRLPDGAFADKIKQAQERNMISYLELSTAFIRPKEATRGGMVKELGTLHYPKKSFQRIPVKEIQAIDYNGKPVHLLCPSVRGRYYEKALDSVRNAIDYGFENLAYDEEAWGNGVSVCFCDRCKNAFKAFLKKRYPNIPYQDPAITVRQPGKYDALENAWWDFKTDQVADLYAGIRKVADSHKNPSGKPRDMYIWLSSSLGEPGQRYGAIADRLTDYKKFGQIFDWIAPMMYTDSSSTIAANARAANKLLKGLRAKLIMGLCPNRYYEYFRVESQSFGSEDIVLEQILESFFAGARGVMFWSHRGGFRGAKDFRNIALAVKMTMPIEDILLKGSEVKLSHSNSAVTVTAWKYNGEYAVFLRNYDHGKMRTVLEIPKGLKAVDTLTGKTVSGNVEFDSSRLKVLKLTK